MNRKPVQRSAAMGYTARQRVRARRGGRGEGKALECVAWAGGAEDPGPAQATAGSEHQRHNHPHNPRTENPAPPHQQHASTCVPTAAATAKPTPQNPSRTPAAQ
ncbi:hypothetical protein Scel_82640 [Streptomyces cellostaticus]|nr:hypothetical protein Scel_82640 [Streptomyces cellostaticus]